MHRYSIAHLDISLRNIVTDHEGHYAYIDFEMSRQFDTSCTPLVHIYRATEVPPECNRDISVDPFKVDVWALAVLILRASKVRNRIVSLILFGSILILYRQLTGYWLPELMFVLKPMLDEEPSQRPSAISCLETFDKITTTLGYKIGPSCNTSH